MIRLSALLCAGALLIAGCGGGSGATAEAQPSTAPATASATGQAFNDADVMFAQMMVPHHRQGIELAGLAGTRASGSDVKTLAAAISATQLTEVETISGWLRDWKQPATAPADAHAAHGGMPGTSNIEIRTLKEKSGAAFDRALLNMLIAHQDDAIQLARTEVASGSNAEAKALASRIDKSRSAQIAQMLKMLGQG